MNRNLHEYEKVQRTNVITRMLHRTRYRNLLLFFSEIAEKVNDRPIRVVDVGCGVGKAYNELDRNFDIEYFGVELCKDYVDLAKERYGENDNFVIFHDSIENKYDLFADADVVIGLESFEHIPERIVVRVVEAIADAGVDYFYCTVPNEIGPAILVKNAGSFLMRYGRYKEYEWRETWEAFLCNLDKVGLHGTGHKGFDWRWLAQTIRHNMVIEKITVSPVRGVPRFISPSIGFACKKRLRSA